MINVSDAYKTAVVASNREFKTVDKIIFSDGTEFELETNDFMSYSINEAVSEPGKFQMGAAIIKEYSAVLNNTDGKFDQYNFDEADILAIVGIKLADGTWELLQKGRYRVVQAKKGDYTISVTAYDSMLFFDRPYSESALDYPASIQQIIQAACTECQMTFDARSVQMGDFVVQKRPRDNTITYRDVISYCAQIMGCYARINHLDSLEFGWYDFSTPDHTFDDFKTKTVNTDDILFSGVCIDAENENGDLISVQDGTEDYMVRITENPLIQSTEAAMEVLGKIKDKIAGKRIRTYNIAVRSDPCIEAGDGIKIVEAEKEIISVITNTTFVFYGDQKLECSAELPAEKRYTKYSAATKIISKAKKDTETKLDAYDIAVQNINQLAANTFGFYATTITLEDGSTVAYRHDKPSLEQSRVVYKSGIDGFFVTDDYQGSDEETTAAGKWSAGFDSEGNAVTNILSVIGINFSWAHGGELVLGGKENGNGRLVIQDATGALIGYVDNTGVNFNQGNFSGKMSASNITGSNISGSHISGSEITTKQTGNYRYISMYNGSLSFYSNDSDLGTYAGTFYPEVIDPVIDDGFIIEDCSYPSMFFAAPYGIDFKVNNKMVFGTRYDPNQKSYGVYINAPLSAKTIWTDDLYPQGDTLYLNSATLYLNSTARIYPVTWTGSGNTYKGVEIRNGLYVDGRFYATDKQSVVETEDYGKTVLSCYELPETYYGDIGGGTLDEEGKCYVQINNVLKEVVNTAIEYVVFLQKEGPGDIWIQEKTEEYFIVSGTPNLKFSYEIKGKRIGYENERFEVFDEPDSQEKEIDYEKEALETLKQLQQETEDTTYENINQLLKY